MKRFFTFLLLLLALSACGCASTGSGDTFGQTSSSSEAHSDKPIIILHTNDVHGGIDDNIGYAGLKAYMDDLEKKHSAARVLLVDAGDAVQGSSLAMLTEGTAIIDLMNAVAYDYFVPGNHEFDYGMPHHFALTKKLNARVLSSNFLNVRDKSTVYPPYDIYTVDGIDIAFVGVSTPESLTKASVQTFQDPQGRLLYTFLEAGTGAPFYENVQQSVDDAREAGADYVIAVVHLGIEESAEPWRSTDLIAHVEGIDVVIDGHSHSVLEGEVHKDKSGERVLLSQTGTKLQYIGKVVIDPRKDAESRISANLIHADDIKLDDNPQILAMIADIQDDFAKILAKKVAYSDYDLVTRDEDISSRSGETNLGDLVADAYRTLLGTQVGLSNGGGIRANIDKGHITYQNIIDLHPFSNSLMSVEVRGKTLKDALEMGAKSLPSADGGFIQVSGMTYEVNSSIPSSVKVDDRGNFLSVDGAYRVHNIRVGGKALDENALYSVASSDYVLKGAGDGMTMFQGARVLKDMFITDSDALIAYISKHLKGRIPQKYADPQGAGRIVIR